MSETVIHFHNPSLFTGDTGVVDSGTCTIKGVSLITCGVEAEGHSLFVDKTTLTQLHDLAKKMGQLPVTQDHEGGIDDVNGWISNFRIDGDSLRGDWHLLETHKSTETMLERAAKQPGTFGLSVAFRGPPKGVKVAGKSCARAEKLLSADVVRRPAANPNGLFQVPKQKEVDSRKFLNFQNMADELQNQEPTLAQILQAVQGLSEKVGTIEAAHADLAAQISGQGNQGLTQEEIAELTELYNMPDDQLAKLGVDRDKVNAMVDQYNESLGEAGEDEVTPEGGEGGEEAAAVGAAAGGGETAAFRALHRELVQLKSKIESREQREIQFQEAELTNEVNAKIELIAKQRDDLKTFSEKCVAKIEALELHVRTGTRPVKAGIDTGVRLFGANDQGELHPFQERLKAIKLEKKCTDGEAIKFAIKETNGEALHRDWIKNQAVHA